MQNMTSFISIYKCVSLSLLEAQIPSFLFFDLTQKLKCIFNYFKLAYFNNKYQHPLLSQGVNSIL